MLLLPAYASTGKTTCDAWALCDEYRLPLIVDEIAASASAAPVHSSPASEPASRPIS